jgi:hypothetical protein
MRVSRDWAARTISLSQTAYIEKIAKRLALDNANPVSTPLDKNVILSKALCPTTDDEIEYVKKFPYLVAIGSLMYAAMGTRPDIAFAVAHLSQFSSNPGPAHWSAAQRVVQYLVTTKEMVLVLGVLNAVKLLGWVLSR